MKPVYLDLHIHTSEDEENLNQNYNLDLLLDKIKDVSQDSEFLISLTDHNTINKSAYLKLLSKTPNIILGVELHVINSRGKPPYHCHFYFNLEINEGNIDQINTILDELYPTKKVAPPYDNVKNIEEIISKFDSYDFLILPHGGQSHSTFNKSVDGQFDTRLQKSLYYNYFDGFTARNQEGLEETVEYFQRLGINEYINLITCTDNYSPTLYPNPKVGGNSSSFLPTWMLAEPTFEGLRISLSESSRFIYSDDKPSDWAEYIRGVQLEDEYIKIDVKLTPGLNVVIGDSSSGKTLFVDTIMRRAKNDFDDSKYHNYGIKRVNVINPSRYIPHYIDQNFITSLISRGNNRIEDIDLIEKIFPDDEETGYRLESQLNTLNQDIKDLIDNVEKVEEAENEITRIPAIGMLVKYSQTKENFLESVIPSADLITKMVYEKHKYEEHIQALKDIEEFMSSNVFSDYDTNDFSTIREKLERVLKKSNSEKVVREIIRNTKTTIESAFIDLNTESETKKQNFQRLIENINIYKRSLVSFNETLNKIKSYSFQIESREVKSMGHTLSIEYTFSLTNQDFLEKVNNLLKTEYKICSLDDLTPCSLYKSKFKDRPRIDSYDDFKRLLYQNFTEANKKRYKITTSKGRDFDGLSPGWKTSVLLDLILGYDGDNAPLIIDQPEDNLANSYINDGLIKAVKDTKVKKQVIIVSHNATIPMLADAQNVVFCGNQDGKIIIKARPLEGELDGKRIVDLIATITDGGKHSVRKRFKKYNMKNFEE